MFMDDVPVPVPVSVPVVDVASSLSSSSSSSSSSSLGVVQKIKKPLLLKKLGIKSVVEMFRKTQNRSVWSIIVEQNRYDKDLLTQLVHGQLTGKNYKSLLSERMQGQWNWGMDSFNIRESHYLCKNACKYCYVGPMFARFGRACETPKIEDLMPVDHKKVNQRWTPSQRKVIFFPSTSDIFVENAVDYVNVCRKIIDAGHESFS